MSGGHFDYEQFSISRIADKIQSLIDNNDDKSLNEWGDTVGRGYPPKVIAKFKRAVAHLRLAAVYAHRIDWLVSGDDSEEAFLKRLQDDLDNHRASRKGASEE